MSRKSQSQKDLDYQREKQINRHYPGGSDGKASACNVGDLGSVPGTFFLSQKKVTIFTSLKYITSIKCLQIPKQSVLSTSRKRKKCLAGSISNQLSIILKKNRSTFLTVNSSYYPLRFILKYLLIFYEHSFKDYYKLTVLKK